MGKAKTRRKIDAGVLTQMLQRRCARPGNVFMSEVSSGTGAMAHARADAIAVSCWPSRGMHFSGFEIKVSRQDWVHELARPRKAEAIGQFCHYWWLVVGDASIVQDGELPSGWGLLAAKGGKLFTIRDAPLLEPKPPTITFVCSVFRKYFGQMIPKASVDAVLEGERAEMTQQIERRLRSRAASTHQTLQDLTERVSVFEKASGISIRDWNLGRVGECVKVLSNRHGLDTETGSLKSARDRLSHQLESVQRCVAELEAIDRDSANGNDVEQGRSAGAGDAAGGRSADA